MSQRFVIAGACAVVVAGLAPRCEASTQASVPAGFTDPLVADTLAIPVGMAFLPDGRLLIVEQSTARIRLLAGAPGTPVHTIGAVPGVSTGGERGLLGIAVDPRWPLKPYVYVHHTRAGTPGTVCVARFTLGGDRAGTGDRALVLDPASRYELIGDAPDDAPNHNGGTVRFGPDGMLYVSLGEDAQACAAQDTTSLRGVLLRLDVASLPDGPGAATRDLITPADNPFVGAASANARLVWALGLRNPFRFAIDAATGAAVVGDVGQSRWEEVDLADRGGLDFGWPLWEGRASYASCPGVSGIGTTEPIFEYDRTAAGASEAAVIAAARYRAPAGGARSFPAEYDGDIFLSDYYGGFLWRIRPSGDRWSIAPPVEGQPTASHWAEGFTFVSDYAIGPDGALWYCRQATSLAAFARSGQIRRISFVAPEDTVPAALPEFRIEPPRPLPARDEVRLQFRLDRPAQVAITVLDVRGRAVRRLPVEAFAAGGPYVRVWDGTDDARRRAPSGLYFARYAVGGRAFVQRVVLVR